MHVYVYKIVPNNRRVKRQLVARNFGVIAVLSKGVAAAAVLDIILMSEFDCASAIPLQTQKSQALMLQM